MDVNLTISIELPDWVRALAEQLFPPVSEGPKTPVVTREEFNKVMEPALRFKKTPVKRRYKCRRGCGEMTHSGACEESARRVESRQSLRRQEPELQRLPPARKPPIPAAAVNYYPYLNLHEAFQLKSFTFEDARNWLKLSILTASQAMTDLQRWGLMESFTEKNVAWFRLKPFKEPTLKTHQEPK